MILHKIKIIMEKRGGKRPGAGRKASFGEPTTQVRIPNSQVPAIVSWLEDYRQTKQQVDVDRLVVKQMGAIAVDPQPVPLWLNAFLHTVPAGFPSPADDYAEKLDLNTHLIQHPSATFIVRVSGHSMVGAGIFDGDELIVDRAIQPAHGHVVVAVVDGELTVKRLHRQGAQITLKAENAQYPDLPIRPEQDFRIWGVVTRVLHKV